MYNNLISINAELPKDNTLLCLLPDNPQIINNKKVYPEIELVDLNINQKLDFFTSVNIGFSSKIYYEDYLKNKALKTIDGLTLHNKFPLNNRTLEGYKDWKIKEIIFHINKGILENFKEEKSLFKQNYTCIKHLPNGKISIIIPSQSSFYITEPLIWVALGFLTVERIEQVKEEENILGNIFEEENILGNIVEEEQIEEQEEEQDEEEEILYDLKYQRKHNKLIRISYDKSTLYNIDINKSVNIYGFNNINNVPLTVTSSDSVDKKILIKEIEVLKFLKDMDLDPNINIIYYLNDYNDSKSWSNYNTDIKINSHPNNIKKLGESIQKYLNIELSKNSIFKIPTVDLTFQNNQFEIGFKGSLHENKTMYMDMVCNKNLSEILGYSKLKITIDLTKAHILYNLITIKDYFQHIVSPYPYYIELLNSTYKPLANSYKQNKQIIAIINQHNIINKIKIILKPCEYMFLKIYDKDFKEIIKKTHITLIFKIDYVEN